MYRGLGFAAGVQMGRNQNFVIGVVHAAVQHRAAHRASLWAGFARHRRNKCPQYQGQCYHP